MSFITNAIGSVVGDLTGANQQAQAAQSAAQTQANAANYAANLQNQQFQTNQQNMSPYMGLGTAAMPQLMNLLGVGPQGSAGIQTALQNVPGYQFTLNQGLQQLQNQQSATGQNLSGAQQKGLQQYTTGLAQSNYQNYLNNYMNSVGMGQNAAAGLGTMGMQNAQNVGNTLMGGANATAAGQVAAGNAQSNAVNGLMQLGLGGSGIYSLGAKSGMNSAISGLFGGGGGAATGYTGASGLSSLAGGAGAGATDYSLGSLVTDALPFMF